MPAFKYTIVLHDQSGLFPQSLGGVLEALGADNRSIGVVRLEIYNGLDEQTGVKQ